MRAQAAFEHVTKTIDHFDVLGVEEAILQADIDAIGHRSANAREDLPSKPGVRIVETRRAVGVDGRLDLGPGDTDTATDEALQAVIGTEVGQAVDHEAQRVDVAVRRELACGCEARTGTGREAERADDKLVGVGFTVARFGFDPDRAEIVTNETAEVIAGVVILGELVFDAIDVEVEVFDQHRTAFDLHVPLAVTCKCRRCEHRRSHRHSDDDIAHYCNSPL